MWTQKNTVIKPAKASTKCDMTTGLNFTESFLCVATLASFLQCFNTNALKKGSIGLFKLRLNLDLLRICCLEL